MVPVPAQIIQQIKCNLYGTGWTVRLTLGINDMNQITPRKSLKPAFRKVKPHREAIEDFKKICWNVSKTSMRQNPKNSIKRSSEIF